MVLWIKAFFDGLQGWELHDIQRHGLEWWDRNYWTARYHWHSEALFYSFIFDYFIYKESVKLVAQNCMRNFCCMNILTRFECRMKVKILKLLSMPDDTPQIIRCLNVLASWYKWASCSAPMLLRWLSSPLCCRWLLLLFEKRKKKRKKKRKIRDQDPIFLKPTCTGS